jgi:hypothetical protein
MTGPTNPPVTGHRGGRSGEGARRGDLVRAGGPGRRTRVARWPGVAGRPALGRRTAPACEAHMSAERGWIVEPQPARHRVEEWAAHHRSLGHHPHPAPTPENPERWECDCPGHTIDRWRRSSSARGSIVSPSTWTPHQVSTGHHTGVAQDDDQSSVVAQLLGALQLRHEILDVQRWKRRDPHRPSGTEVDRQVRDRRVV